MEPLSRKADEIQASARVHRIGQLRPVQIIRIVTRGTVEQGIIASRGGDTGTTADEEAAALSGILREQLTDEILLRLAGRPNLQLE